MLCTDMMYNCMPPSPLLASTKSLSASSDDISSHTIVRHFFENVSRSPGNGQRLSAAELEDSGFQVCIGRSHDLLVKYEVYNIIVFCYTVTAVYTACKGCPIIIVKVYIYVHCMC